jgi:hypothetical protein
MFDSDPDIRPGTEDPRIDELVTELVTLRPDWRSANADYERSCAILKALNDMQPSPYQTNQITSYVQYHWKEAATKARELGLFSTNSSYAQSISQRLAGICLVRSTMMRSEAPSALDIT